MPQGRAYPANQQNRRQSPATGFQMPQQRQQRKRSQFNHASGFQNALTTAATLAPINPYLAIPGAIAGYYFGGKSGPFEPSAQDYQPFRNAFQQYQRGAQQDLQQGVNAIGQQSSQRAASQGLYGSPLGQSIIQNNQNYALNTGLENINQNRYQFEQGLAQQQFTDQRAYDQQMQAQNIGTLQNLAFNALPIFNKYFRKHPQEDQIKSGLQTGLGDVAKIAAGITQGAQVNSNPNALPPTPDSHSAQRALTDPAGLGATSSARNANMHRNQTSGGGGAAPSATGQTSQSSGEGSKNQPAGNISDPSIAMNAPEGLAADAIEPGLGQEIAEFFGADLFNIDNAIKSNPSALPPQLPSPSPHVIPEDRIIKDAQGNFIGVRPPEIPKPELHNPNQKGQLMLLGDPLQGNQSGSTGAPQTYEQAREIMNSLAGTGQSVRGDGYAINEYGGYAQPTKQPGEIAPGVPSANIRDHRTGKMIPIENERQFWMGISQPWAVFTDNNLEEWRARHQKDVDGGFIDQSLLDSQYEEAKKKREYIRKQRAEQGISDTDPGFRVDGTSIRSGTIPAATQTTPNDQNPYNPDPSALSVAPAPQQQSPYTPNPGLSSGRSPQTGNTPALSQPTPSVNQQIPQQSQVNPFASAEPGSVYTEEFAMDYIKFGESGAVDGKYASKTVVDPTSGYNVGWGRSITHNGLDVQNELIPMLRASYPNDFQIQEKLRILGIKRDHKGHVTMTPAQFNQLFPFGINETQATMLLNNDIGRSQSELNGIFGEQQFYGLDPERQAVLIDMMHTLGLNKFRKFSKMIAAINAGNYYEAAYQMRNSLWYKQVGPRRANPLIAKMIGDVFNAQDQKSFNQRLGQ